MLVGIPLALFWDRMNTVQELFRQVYFDEMDLKRDVYNSVEYHGSHLHPSCFLATSTFTATLPEIALGLFHTVAQGIIVTVVISKHPNPGPSSLKYFKKDPAVLTRIYFGRLDGRCRRVTVEVP